MPDDNQPRLFDVIDSSAKEYLWMTDWRVIRWMESYYKFVTNGTPVPEAHLLSPEFLAERDAARAAAGEG